MNFFAELRRRNVYRAAVFYAASAWLLVQVATQVFPLFHIAEWVLRWIVVAVAVGFPFALLFAWFYEWTPQGFKRDSDVDRSSSITRATGKKLDRWIIAVMAVAIVLLLTNAFVWHRGAGLADKTATESESDTRPAAARSIAVLPFQNMSDDRSNQYFADGIAEELLNRLAHVTGLKVAGRTSSFAFRDRGQDLREIAAKLGVANMLEGSVRRAGSRVRITAQLIKAQDGFHTWSETYDRDITDIFAVQDEIAGAIADALKVNLIGHDAATPVSVDAYDAYLKAQSLLATRDVGNMQAARKQFRAALDLAPDYVPAMVALARADLLIPMWTQQTDTAGLVQEAEQLTLRALAIEPDNAAAHAALGTLNANYRWRWQDAGREFARALELAPGNAEIVNFAGDFYRMLVDPERALATEQRALELDPLAPYNQDDLGWLGLAFGDYPLAIEHANAARAMAPDMFDPYYVLVWSYGRLQRFAELHKAIAEAHERTRGSEPQFLNLDAWAAIAEGRREDGLNIQSRLEPFVERGEYSSAFFGFNYLLLGDSTRARRWLERAYDQRDASLVFQEPVELARIGADPVTRDLLDRPGLKELVEIRKRNGAYKLPSQ